MEADSGRCAHMMIEVFRDVRIKFAGKDRAKGTFEEYKDVSLSSSCLFGTYSVDPATSKVTMKMIAQRSRTMTTQRKCAHTNSGATF
jgi:hypothetical protein